MFFRKKEPKPQVSEKEIRAEEKRAERRKIYKLLLDLDIKSNYGVSRGYISMKYKYLGKEYDTLGYKLISSGNIIIKNEDYEVIDVLISYDYTKGILNGLFAGNLEV